MTWNSHVDESAKSRYDMILGIDLLTESLLNIKLSDRIIVSDYGPLKGSTETVVDQVTYEFKGLKTWELTPETFFITAYTEEVYES